jgi:quercetin dioxygenase-like cupin family protein
MRLKISSKEKAILQQLDAFVRAHSAFEIIDTSIKRVTKELEASSEALFGWSAIPLDIFPAKLPAAVGSCWLFVIRAGIPPERHRHPGSRQRTLSFRGSGDLQVWDGAEWVSNPLQSSEQASLEGRWVSIPPNAWHRPVVTEDWVVISFHTAPEEDLMEISDENRRVYELNR